MFGLLLVAGLLLRWVQLDFLPLHHDESIHAMFGQYFYDFPEIQYYKYDPEYHGPTFYMLLRAMYVIFGASDFSARFPIAVLGSLLMLVPLVFRRYLAPVTTLFVTAFIALSPTLVYWSRFAREDYLIFLGMFLALYGATLAKPAARTWLVATGIAINWATKANVFVFLAILVGYLVFEFAYNRIVLKRNESLAGDMLRNMERYWVEAIAGIAGAAYLFCYLITSGFRHMEAIGYALGLRGLNFLFLKPFHAGDSRWLAQWQDAMRHDVLLYWYDKHATERITGPFNFHLYQLTWYELLFMALFALQIGIFIWRSGTLTKMVAGILWGIGIALFCYYHFLDAQITEIGIWKAFKLKGNLDLLGLFLLAPYAVLVTCHHLWRRERALAFFGYFFTASLFTYSYLGEKVPWLSSYPLLAGYAYFALYFQDAWNELPLRNWRNFPVRYVLLAIGAGSFILGILFAAEDVLRANASWFVVGLALPGLALMDSYRAFLGTCNLRALAMILLCVFNLRVAVMTSFPPKDKELGYISQVHTTIEFRDLALMIRENIEKQVFGFRPFVHVTGEASWPITWYFRGLPEYKFDALDMSKRDQYAYIFDTWKDDDTVPEGFVSRRVNLRGWWVPDFSQMTLKKFLNYSVNLEPWSGTGYTYVRLLTNRKLLPPLGAQRAAGASQ